MLKKSLAECSEQELVEIGVSAASCLWTLGEAASLWCRKYARGRTAIDYSEQTGWGQKTVQRAIAVFEKMSPLREKFPTLFWTHFFAAMTWGDAEHWLDQAATRRLSKDRMRAARAESQALAAAPASDCVAVDDDELEDQVERAAIGPGQSIRELTDTQLNEVDNTELLNELNKALSKFRKRFAAQNGLVDFADALANCEQAVRESLEVR